LSAKLAALTPPETIPAVVLKTPNTVSCIRFFHVTDCSKISNLALLYLGCILFNSDIFLFKASFSFLDNSLLRDASVKVFILEFKSSDKFATSKLMLVLIPAFSINFFSSSLKL